MNKFKEIINLYKTNRKLFDVILLTVNIVLILWQCIFTLISPNRGNVILLILLVLALIYELFKDS